MIDLILLLYFSLNYHKLSFINKFTQRYKNIHVQNNNSEYYKEAIHRIKFLWYYLSRGSLLYMFRTRDCCYGSDLLRDYG